MSAFSCAQVRDVAPELALGVLGGAERAEAFAHLADCSRCQAYVAELTEAADVLPMLAGEVEPPPGFEGRVLAGLSSRPRRLRRRWFASLAVAAAAAAILSITLVRVIDAGNEPTAVRTAAGAPAVMTQARMVTEGDGAPAGWAYVSGERNVALAVAYGIETGNYDIAVQHARGPKVVIGAVEVAGYRGSWTGTSRVAIAAGDTISLVSQTGEPVCHGTVV